MTPRTSHPVQSPPQAARGSARTVQTTSAVQYGGYARGFTLVELLVVVAIIALLLGILVPALSKARQAAQTVVCGSNLRQLATANTGYANESDGHYVPAAYDIATTNRRRWHGRRDTADEPFDPARSPLVDYLGSDGRVKACPAFDEFDEDGFEAGNGGYGYNGVYIGGRYDKHGNPTLSHPVGAQITAQVGDVRRPGQTVMFTDAAFRQLSGGGAFSLIEYSFIEPPLLQDDPGEPTDRGTVPSIHFRHMGKTSVAWGDGHVDTAAMDFTGPAGPFHDVHESLNLGWFGEKNNELYDLK